MMALTGQTLRDAGIARVSEGKDQWLAEARSNAVTIARIHGTVSINELRQVIELPDGYHPNAWGAVFKVPDLEPCGYTQATHPSAHARVVRVYKLKGN